MRPDQSPLETSPGTVFSSHLHTISYTAALDLRNCKLVTRSCLRTQR